MVLVICVIEVVDAVRAGMVKVGSVRIERIGPRRSTWDDEGRHR